MSVAGLLDTEVSRPDQVAEVVSGMRGHLEVIQSATEALSVPRIEESATVMAGSITPQAIGLADQKALPSLVEIFVRYDAYFGTRRSAAMTASNRLRQLVDTVCEVADDLPHCLIDLNEMRAIVDAVAVALSSFCQGEVPDRAAGALTRAHFRPEREPRQEDVRVEALYRWKIGHHLFNLFSVHAAEALLAVSECAGSEGVEMMLKRASVLLRGTTAAMWYAEAFPRKLYVEYIRPTMVEASGRGSGFSGTDNLEFRYFKVAVERAFETLQSNYGSPSGWPDDLWTAAYGFWDTRQIDLEHHTLLAEKVVGNAPSLKQIRLMENSAADDDLPAVEALRGLAAMVRKRKEGLA